jgi:hypothetical protein
MFHTARASQDNSDIKLALIANFDAWDFKAKRTVVQTFGCDLRDWLPSLRGDLHDRLATQVLSVGIAV